MIWYAQKYPSSALVQDQNKIDLPNQLVLVFPKCGPQFTINDELFVSHQVRNQGPF